MRHVSEFDLDQPGQRLEALAEFVRGCREYAEMVVAHPDEEDEWEEKIALTGWLYDYGEAFGAWVYFMEAPALTLAEVDPEMLALSFTFGLPVPAEGSEICALFVRDSWDWAAWTSEEVGGRPVAQWATESITLQNIPTLVFDVFIGPDPGTESDGIYHCWVDHLAEEAMPDATIKS